MKIRVWLIIALAAVLATGCPLEEESWNDTNNQDYNNSRNNDGNYNNGYGNYNNTGNNSTGNNSSGGYCDSAAPNQQMLLPFSSFQQWCSQWCWAAVSTSIANYFGTPMTDSLGRQWPARECYLASINAGFNDWNTCCQYAACGYQACNQPVAWHNMDDALAAVGLYGRVLQRPLTEPEIQREITNGRPIVVGFQGTGIGHVALITGYTPGTPFIYQLDDPWPHTGMGSTRFQLTYQQILYGPDGQTPWGGSWYRISGRPDGCVQSVNPDCSCQTEEDTNPPPACGDGVCEDGEDGCMADCGSDPEPVCGDGVCEDGESGSCSQDCGTDQFCNDPNYPVDCNDGTCWPEGTDCESAIFPCGENDYRCRTGGNDFWANCCNDQFVTCPFDYPFFCPADNRCYADDTGCPTNTCTFHQVACKGVDL